MQQLSVFQTTHVSRGTPPSSGGVNSAWLGGIKFFRREYSRSPMGWLDKPLSVPRWSRLVPITFSKIEDMHFNQARIQL